MTTPATLGTVDYVTAVVVLIVAAVVTFSAAAVVLQYWRRLRRGHAGRLLLWHVVTIAASVAGTWLTLAMGNLAILGILDTPRPVRLAGYAVFGLGTIVSLALIGLSLWKADAPAAVEDGSA